MLWMFVFWMIIRHHNTLAKEVCYGNYGCFSNISPVKYMGSTYYPLPQTPEEINTTFIMHNRHTSENGEILDNSMDSILSSSINLKSETYFIVHGYLSSSRNIWVKELKDKLLDSGDFNVILVDWELGADDSYEISACNTRLVGAQIYFLITKLEKFKKTSRKRVHLVGHSLGAHVCGFAGKKLKGLARITGLDPANPGFNGVKSSFRLSRNDANFVDVIHTCAYESNYKYSLGIRKALGHADFYPNGGSGQPECSYADLICSHSMATALYTVSITTEDVYIGKQCPGSNEFENDLCESCQGNRCNSMGFYAIKPKKPTSYYLKTIPLTDEAGVTHSTFWNTVKDSVKCSVLGYCPENETTFDQVLPKKLESKIQKKQGWFEWLCECFGYCKKASYNTLPTKLAPSQKDPKTTEAKPKKSLKEEETWFDLIQNYLGLSRPKRSVVNKASYNTLPTQLASNQKYTKTNEAKPKKSLKKKETWFDYIRNCLGLCRHKQSVLHKVEHKTKRIKKKLENLQHKKLKINERDLQSKEGEKELSYISFFIYGDQNLIT